MTKKTTTKLRESAQATGMTPRETRQALISEIERARKSHVITYVTSTRPNLEVQMALDVVRYVFEHLELIKKNFKGSGKPKIDLLIHSNGGDGTMPWRLVTLIREYTDDFGVLIPCRAFSAATLTALGANEIVMHPMGMLGPTDPSVTNHFNPKDGQGRPLSISVEDVTAYLQLVKEDAGIRHEDELVQAFLSLAKEVHPLALGNVKRFISQSRMMAGKLLGLHIDHKENRVEEIVENLTSKLFYHGHPINRKEAREQLGLRTVKDAPETVSQAMWRLYCEYEASMQLLEPFDAANEFAQSFPALAPGSQEVTPEKTVYLTFVESKLLCHSLELSYKLSGSTLPNGSQMTTFINSGQKWKSC